MATSVVIPIADYQNTVYRPDREYIDGEILERNMGKWEHSRLQALLTIWFGQHEQQWNIQTATELRTQVSASRVRIPDLVLVRPRGGTEAHPDILTDPPLLVVEILSPGDTYADTQQRADDYLRMGVPTIWIIDPETRTARICSGFLWTQATRLAIPGTPIFVDLPDLFAALDPPPATPEP